MRFRTEIEPMPRQGWIDRGTAVTLLGSCFSDNIGTRLCRDGFDCVHNPLGPLFNPLSIARAINLAVAGNGYNTEPLVEGPRGWHCMDFASRYSGSDSVAVAAAVNSDLEVLTRRLTIPGNNVLVITLGSAYVYMLDGVTPVGNCHKFDSRRFDRICLDVDAAADAIIGAISKLPPSTRVILTVSPVRHLDEGLHGNTLCKAVLHLACRHICEATGAVYFPAYEMIMDDLRDYRFYADDLKHPSEMACDYVYNHFCSIFATDSAMEAAVNHRRNAARLAHRTILHDGAANDKDSSL